MQDRVSSAPQPKKAYTEPKLVTHGTVQQLTQGGFKLPLPCPSGHTGSNTPFSSW
jgi:hypothetical protein